MARTDMTQIQALYDDLWNDAMASFARGEDSADPHLSSLETDERSGLTLIARIPPDLHSHMMTFIDELRRIAPGQFFYVPEQLHFTVMTLIPVRQKIDPASVGVTHYEKTCREVLSDAKAFEVEFCGITATNSAVMIQGFPAATLNRLRERLRVGLSAVGLGERLDMRYRLVGAHVTVMRFASTPEDLPTLVNFLQEERASQQDFGSMVLHEITLVHNDYYLLPEKSEVLARFPLG